MNAMCKAGAHAMCAGYRPVKRITVDNRAQRVIARERITVKCECACHG